MNRRGCRTLLSVWWMTFLLGACSDEHRELMAPEPEPTVPAGGVAFQTSMETGQQTAPVATGATGSAELILVKETGEISGSLETEGMEATAAHLHRGFAGQNGPILVGLEQDPDDPGHWDFPQGSTLDEEGVAAVLAGETYVNAHSEAWPAGEIRGQVLPPTVETFIVTPSGGEQVPAPVVSDGFARAAVTLDRDTNVGQVHFTSSNISIVAAHLHEGIAGTNGPIVVEMTQDMQNMNHWSAEDVDFSDLATVLDSAALYFNMHTMANAAGELRGQIVPDGYRLGIASMVPGEVVSSVAVDSSASGTIAVTFNVDTRQAQIHVNTIDLVDPLEAHVHIGATGETGDVLVALNRDPLNGDHWMATASLNADEAMLLEDGGLYAEIHSAAWPDGEIRGQLNLDTVATGDDSGPDDGDVPPDQSPEFSAVQTIFNSNCVVCHGVSGGLSLESPGSYDNLVNVPSSQVPSRDRVEPFEPDNSYLVWKIEGRQGIVGGRMPLGGQLPQSEIDLIRNWIEAGATR